jgi:uncharacterized protein YacL
MNISLAFIRTFFISICILFFTSYMATTSAGGFNFTNIVIGISSGAAFGLALVGMDLLLKRFNLLAFNTAVLGLFLGYLMGEAILLIFNGILDLNRLQVAPESIILFRNVIFLSCAYFGMIMITRAANDWHLSIPFIKLKTADQKRKEILVDWSIFLDARIIELATSGLLDGNLVMPRFMLKELYTMLDSPDEAVKTKAKRCLEVFKKLEGISTLDLRHLETDFADIKDPVAKLIQLARILEANIITADIAKLQQVPSEGIRIINIHMISNAWKPMTGETINIKIQRYGKEPRQGVGYLEDGTMVVVNGGAEFIGETIKAQVLSVKHTSSGRMIFCNAAEESIFSDQEFKDLVPAMDLEGAQKSYF